MDKTNTIYLNRLLGLYNPWKQLDLPRISRNESISHLTEKYPSVKEFNSDGYRNIEYDYGRIFYFLDEINKVGKYPNSFGALQIDCYCHGYTISPIPFLVDGHHRLCAADLACIEKVKISFGGRVDLLRYLQGKRKTVPKE